MKSALVICLLFAATVFAQENRTINLSTSKALTIPAPGAPQRTNSFPTAAAVSPDGNWVALLNNGYGTTESKGQQSIAILDLRTNELKDFPDSRLGRGAAQTYFLGMAWSSDGHHLYASMASITDPLGDNHGNTGNGIAVYRFDNGTLASERFIRIPLQPLARGKKFNKLGKVPDGKAIPYPAGIAVVGKGTEEKLVVADNLSDDALLIEVATGRIIHRFDLSTSEHVPASYPYAVVAYEGRAYVSLWNASRIAELNLETGEVARVITAREPKARGMAGSHPSAMIFSECGAYLYATLSNSDEVAVIDTRKGRVTRYLSTRLSRQKHGGNYPNALALSDDGKRLFVANASSNAIAVFSTDVRETCQQTQDHPSPKLRSTKILGFIPTEWYPTALAVHEGNLFIATGKGQGTGPNSAILARTTEQSRRHPYIASLIHGSLARVNIADVEKNLPQLTAIAEDSNFQQQRADEFERKGERITRLPNLPLFAGRKNPIKHVIYIIKENRTYDQLFGDMEGADGDPSLVVYGEDITPNQHALARQFGVLDNFYDSGEISGNGHVWSTAAITSDYTEKTWEINYRGRERTYDYEGGVSNAIPLEQGIADVNEPGTGYLWANMARHKKTYRHYGEYITSRWCNEFPAQPQSPRAGTPLSQGVTCERTFIRKGEALPPNVGNPKGGASPYAWPVPILARNEATKSELRGHFDPNYPDFRMDYPDQLRADEFLNEFAQYVKAREQKKGRKHELPQFIVMRLPNDHTSGTRANVATPAAAVADNDLAVGRVVEAVSHSPYWDDTAIFILEDDAQDGADHVDAHRSIALVISKYAPNTRHGGNAGRGGERRSDKGSQSVGSSVSSMSSATGVQPFVDHSFYTTVNLIHTMEVLLGVPAMNNNDARAAVMSPLFSGDGSQAAFTADYRNRDNGLIYQMNQPNAPGAKESAAMDFTHADSVDTALLNAILWSDRKGSQPMPKPVHTMCGRGDAGDDDE